MIVSWDGGFITSVVDVGTYVVAVRVAFKYGVSVTAEFEFPVSVVLVDAGGDTVGGGAGWRVGWAEWRAGDIAAGAADP